MELCTGQYPVWNSEKGTLGSENLKHFSGEHPPEPPHKRSITPSVLVKEIS